MGGGVRPLLEQNGGGSDPSLIIIVGLDPSQSSMGESDPFAAARPGVSDPSQSRMEWGSDPSLRNMVGLDPSQSSTGGVRPLSEQCDGVRETPWSSLGGQTQHVGVQDPNSPVRKGHLGTASGPFLGPSPLEALGKSQRAGTGDSGFSSAGGISQRRLKCQGVRTGFWQRSVLKGGGRSGHQSHPRDAPSSSGCPFSAAIGSVTTQKSSLGVPRRAGSVHLTAWLPSSKSEPNLGVSCGLPLGPWGHPVPRKPLLAHLPCACGAW